MSLHTIAGQTAIYFLVDPRCPEAVRYVGRAKAPRIRHLQHCAENSSSTKGQWLEALRMEGIFPQMQIVQWVPDDQADATEKTWIARVRPDFLTNSANAPARPKALTEASVNEDAAQTLTELKAVEKAQIIKVLAQTNWNKLKAAEILGIGRQTLYNKIKEYGLKQ